MRRVAACLALAALVAVADLAWADPPEHLTASPIGIEMVLVSGWEKPFYIARFEVTQGQWRRVMKSNPSRCGTCPDCPVSRIAWGEIETFLSRARELTGWGLRLPTEEEWEHAASGGKASMAFPGTSEPGEVGRFAWFADNSEGQCHPVGTKEPNPFGLYDMGGNVWEWVSATRGILAPADGAGVRPVGVLKGGSWREGVDNLRLPLRADRDPNWLGKGCLPLPLVPVRRQSDDVGFRVAMDAYTR